MSFPSRSTRPSARAPSTTSCIRLRQRTNVDFPQPEGPITAVTRRSRIDIETVFSASVAPKKARSRPARIFSGNSAGEGAMDDRLDVGVVEDEAAIGTLA